MDNANNNRKDGPARGGMAVIKQQQENHAKMMQERNNQQQSLEAKIKADNERIKKAALAMWDKKPEEENNNG